MKLTVLSCSRNLPLFKQKVRYSVHMTPPLNHILSQLNPVHIVLFKIHFTVTIPSKWWLPFRYYSACGF